MNNNYHTEQQMDCTDTVFYTLTGKVLRNLPLILPYTQTWTHSSEDRAAMQDPGGPIRRTMTMSPKSFVIVIFISLPLRNTTGGHTLQ